MIFDVPQNKRNNLPMKFKNVCAKHQLIGPEYNRDRIQLIKVKMPQLLWCYRTLVTTMALG